MGRINTFSWTFLHNGFLVAAALSVRFSTPPRVASTKKSWISIPSWAVLFPKGSHLRLDPWRLGRSVACSTRSKRNCRGRGSRRRVNSTSSRGDPSSITIRLGTTIMSWAARRTVFMTKASTPGTPIRPTNTPTFAVNSKLISGLFTKNICAERRKGGSSDSGLSTTLNNPSKRSARRVLSVFMYANWVVKLISDLGSCATTRKCKAIPRPSGRWVHRSGRMSGEANPRLARVKTRTGSCTLGALLALRVAIMVALACLTKSELGSDIVFSQCSRARGQIVLRDSESHS
mmetsp:Transcript_80567/g.184545  ORF Transcript_80567/g.184545 Transcript_80567/m.184545 type:complete len:289 (-) Transcript_80567:61-927(-)